MSSYTNLSTYNPNFYSHNTFNKNKPPEETITLFIGNIPNDFNDYFFQRILNTCGNVVSWKKPYPHSKFGFVEYENPFTALRAMRLLKEIVFDDKGDCLKAKTDEKVRLRLAKFKEEIESGNIEPEKIPLNVAIPDNIDVTSYLDSVARSKIYSIIKDWIANTKSTIKLKIDNANFDKQLKKSNLKKQIKKIVYDSDNLEKKSSSKSLSPPQKYENLSEGKLNISFKINKGVANSNKKVMGMVKEKSINEGEKIVENIIFKSSIPPTIKITDKKIMENDKDKDNKERKEEKIIKNDEEETHKNKNYKRKRHRIRSHSKRRSSKKITPSRIISKIPKDKEKIYTYKIDWKFIDQEKIIKKKLNKWIESKLLEYIGSNESDITEFVISLLNKHYKAKKVQKELSQILDVDAEEFVIMLWRRLIFEMIYLKKLKYDGKDK